jgi:hypothetical protein
MDIDINTILLLLGGGGLGGIIVALIKNRNDAARVAMDSVKNLLPHLNLRIDELELKVEGQAATLDELTALNYKYQLGWTILTLQMEKAGIKPLITNIADMSVVELKKIVKELGGE